MLSPVDIQNKVFKKSKIGGYNIEDVTEFFDEVSKSYQELTNENFALKDKINVLDESIKYYRSMESTIQNVLVLADKTAQDTKSAAYEKAEQIKKDAEQRAEKITYSAEERVSKILDKGRSEAFELNQKIEEIRGQYVTYRAQFKQMLQSQLEVLEQSEVPHLVNAVNQEIRETDEQAATTDETELSDFEVADSQKDYYTKEYIPVDEEEI